MGRGGFYLWPLLSRAHNSVLSKGRRGLWLSNGVLPQSPQTRVKLRRSSSTFRTCRLPGIEKLLIYLLSTIANSFFFFQILLNTQWLFLITGTKASKRRAAIYSPAKNRRADKPLLVFSDNPVYRGSGIFIGRDKDYKDLRILFYQCSARTGVLSLSVNNCETARELSGDGSFKKFSPVFITNDPGLSASPRPKKSLYSVKVQFPEDTGLSVLRKNMKG